MEEKLTHLSELIKSDNLQQIKYILKEDPKIIGLADEYGVLPLFIAAQEGNYKLLKYIIEYTFASLNVWDNKHQTVLHYAAMGNNLDCFKYLIERVSVDPMEVNNRSQTPLDIAEEYNSLGIINYYKKELHLTPETIYKNPILPGAYPDPSIIRVGQDYYMVNSSFLFFPSIPILHSRDLINWKTIGHAICDQSYIDLSEMGNGRGFWAPDISYNKGKFYITATLRYNDTEEVRRSQMVVWSEKAEGPYSKPTYIDEDGIDPSIFTDDDGKRYMLLNRGARIFEISENGDKKISEAKLLWYGAQKRAPEAPHMIKKDGYYYIFVAEGGTGINHQISVARSKDLMGVYEPCPHNPILKQNDSLHPIQRSGHGKLVSTPEGDWFIVYLCSRMVKNKFSILGRETGLDHVVWTNDGWPLINNNRGPSGAAPIPIKNIKPTKAHSINCYKGIDPEWVFIRNPENNLVSYDNKNNVITLIGTPHDLNKNQSRNILVKRQQYLQCKTTVELSVEIDQENIEAGLTCYYDTSAFFKFFISENSGKHLLNVTEQIGHKQIRTNMHIDFTGIIQMKIDSDYLKRTLFYRMNSTQNWVLFKELSNTYYLSDEGIPGKKFTGTMIGIYSLDHNGKDQIQAKFKDFKMEDLSE